MAPRIIQTSKFVCICHHYHDSESVSIFYYSVWQMKFVYVNKFVISCKKCTQNLITTRYSNIFYRVRKSEFIYAVNLLSMRVLWKIFLRTYKRNKNIATITTNNNYDTLSLKMSKTNINFMFHK
jgi:hypothetical protein